MRIKKPHIQAFNNAKSAFLRLRQFKLQFFTPCLWHMNAGSLCTICYRFFLLICRILLHIIQRLAMSRGPTGQFWMRGAQPGVKCRVLPRSQLASQMLKDTLKIDKKLDIIVILFSRFTWYLVLLATFLVSRGSYFRSYSSNSSRLEKS